MDKMVTKFKMVKEIYVAWLVDKKKRKIQTCTKTDI